MDFLSTSKFNKGFLQVDHFLKRKYLNMMKNMQNSHLLPEQEDQEEEFKNKDTDIDINEIQPTEENVAIQQPNKTVESNRNTFNTQKVKETQKNNFMKTLRIQKEDEQSILDGDKDINVSLDINQQKSQQQQQTFKGMLKSNQLDIQDYQNLFTGQQGVSQFHPQSFNQNQQMQFQKQQQQQQIFSQQINLQQENIKTLKFGDIIYFKFKPEKKDGQNNNSINKDDQFCVIGNTMNGIECVSEQADSLDNPISHFRRCLFKIYNPRELIDYEQYVSKDQQNKQFKIKNFNQKSTSQQEDVVYGKQIMLVHVYSKMLLTVSTETPAKQDGCLEVYLDKNGSEYSIFNILPTDNSKKIGDTIFDSDIVNIQESKENQYFINVSNMSEENKGIRYDVNGSEIGSQFLLKCYMQNEQNQEESENIQNDNDDESFTNNILKSGDIVQIRHLDCKALLSVSEKKLSRFITTKSCKIQYPTEDKIFFTLRQMDEKRIQSADNYDVFFDNDNKITESSYSYFEIQRKNNFIGGAISSQELFRLKNLATGLFLSQDKNNPQKLVLVSNANEEESHFSLVKEKSLNDKEKIFFTDTFKFYSQDQKCFYLQQYPEKSKLPISLQVRSSDNHQKPYIFQFKKCNKLKIEFIEQTFSIYHTLLKFHFFLQKYAVINSKDSDKLNENELMYDYNAATQKQKDLEKEVLNCQNSLNSLENQLTMDILNLDFTMKMKQNYLKEQKHLELILLIAKLIDTMIYATKHTQKEKQKLIKIGNRSELGKIPEKSAQNIAKRYLDTLPPKLYYILYLAVKKNPECCQFIFDNDDFFSGELRYYPNEVGFLLKESISNLSQLKSEDKQGDEIIEWVKLLETLDASKQKVDDQTFYAQLISKALVNPNDEGIMRYQNKCCQEIFSISKKGGKSKALITFGMHEDKPVIIFYKENSLIQYIEENKPLQNSREGLLPVGNFKDKDTACFYLEELCKAIPEKPELAQYINYIAAVVMLYANLCRGRNKKSLKKIQSLGISDDHIMYILKSQQCSINLKTSYYTLYEVLYVDIEPFIQVQKSEKRNFIWDNIHEKSLSSTTMVIFGQYSETVEISKQTKNVDEKMLPLIQEFWERGLPELDSNKLAISKLIKFKEQSEGGPQNIAFFSYSGQDSDPVLIEIERWKQKTKLFLSVIRLTRKIIDLGYMNAITIENLVLHIIQVFSAFTNSSVPLLKSDSWVKRFMNKVVSDPCTDGVGFLNDEIEQILLEVSKIIKLYKKINMNFQLIQLLRCFYNEFNCYNDRKKMTSLSKISKNLLHNMNLKQHATQNPLLESNEDLLQTNQKINKQKILPVNNSKDNNYDKSLQNGIFFKFNTQIENILLRYLLQFKVGTAQNHKEIMSSCIEMLEHQKQFCDQLKLYELIDGEQEITLFKELEGQSLGVRQIVSPFRLEVQVNKILFDEESNKNANIKNDKQSEERMLEINNQLNKICTKMKEIKKDPRLFKKTQNILRNLGTHKSILKLLTLNHNEKVYHDTFGSVIKLFHHFCRNNITNQLELLPIFDQLLNLLKYQLNAQKLIGMILTSLINTTDINIYISKIFQRLSKSDERIEQIQILQIIYSLLPEPNLKEEDFINQLPQKQFLDKREIKLIKKNQQQILSKLLKMQNLIGLIKDYNRNLSDTSNRKEPKQLQEILVDITLYKILTGLIGNLVIQYPLGVIQCQRVFVYEEIKAIISKSDSKVSTSVQVQSIPFLVKKENLRILYQVYMCQYDKINANFSIVEMNDILYHVILQDLKNFKQYLNGLVKKPNQNTMNEEKYQACLKDRQILNDVIQNLFIDNKEQQNILQKQEGQNTANEIINDEEEYWDYLYYGNNWNQTRDGLLCFILDCYHEIKSKNWMQFEYDSQRDALAQEDKLSDLLLALKILLEKIRNSLKVIQNKTQINLQSYIYILSECIVQNPVKKSQVSLNDNNLQIEFQIKDNNLDKTFKDHNLIQLDLNNKDQKKEYENIFFEKIRQLVIAKVISLEQIFTVFGIEFQNIEYEYDLDYERDKVNQGFFTKEEFASTINILLKNFNQSPYIQQQVGKNSEISFDDINEFFSAFTGSSQFSYAKTTEKAVLDKTKFIKKIRDHIESKKSIYDKEILQKDNVIVDLPPDIISIQKYRALKGFITKFQNMVNVVEQQKNQKNLAKYFLIDLQTCHESEQKVLINKFLEQVPLLFQFGKENFMYFFKFFVKYLVEIQVSQYNHLSYNEKDNTVSMISRMKLNTIQSKKKKKHIQYTSQNYRIIQSIISKTSIYRTLLKNITNENKVQCIQSLEILNQLLKLNLRQSQIQLTTIFSDLSFIQTTKYFFTFIQYTFQSYITSIQTITSQKIQPTIKDIQHHQYNELLIIQIFKFIEQSCEHCNEFFQQLFRYQKVSENETGLVSLNIIQEIAYFLINTSKYKSSYFKVFKQVYKNHQKLRFYELIQQSFKTLKNLSNGIKSTNKKLLLENIPFIQFLGTIICDSQIDIKSESLRDIKTMQTVLSAVELLVTLVICQDSQKQLAKVIEIMDLEKLTKIANYIFQTKLKNRLNFIFQERRCNHADSNRCSVSVCEYNYMNSHDTLILNLAFNIVLVLELLLDQIEQEDLAIKLRMKDENYKIFGVFFEMNNKDQDLTGHKNEFDEQKTDQEADTKKVKKDKKLKKQQTTISNMKSFRRQESIYPQNQMQGSRTINNKNEIGSNNNISVYQAQQSIYGLNQYQQQTPGQNNKNIELTQLQKNKKVNPLNFNTNYSLIGKDDSEQGQGEQDFLNSPRGVDQQSPKNTPNYMMNDNSINAFDQNKNPQNNTVVYNNILQKKENNLLKDSLKFYLKFVGKVEIMKEGQLTKLFFRIPFMSNYLTSYMMGNLEKEAKLCKSNKNRLELLINLSSYFQHEMRYGQYISSHYNWLYVILRHSNLQRDFVFLLSVFINLFFVIDFQIDENDQYHLVILQEAYTVFYMLHLVFSFTMLAVEVIERYPLLNYQYLKKDNQRRKNKQQRRELLWWEIIEIYLNDHETMYYVFYTIITCLAFISPLFYSILLTDVIKRSPDLMGIVRVLTYNYKKVLKTAFLTLIIIYSWALIGLLLFAQDFENNTEGVDFSQKKLYLIFSVSILNGLTSSGGIHDILEYKGIDSDNFWERFVFDLTFWIAVNFLMMNLLLGLMIDSFAELRARRKQEEKNLLGKCFVCGLSQEAFEARTLDWQQHQDEEHNVYNYMNYIIYIQNKPSEECDGLEKYVKEQVSNNQTEFFPKRDTLSFHKVKIDISKDKDDNN